MNRNIQKIVLQKAMKSALTLLKDNSISYNNNEFLHLYTHENILYVHALGNFHELTIPVLEYEHELDVIVNYKEFNSSILLMGTVLVLKQSSDNNYLLLTDGNARIKLENKDVHFYEKNIAHVNEVKEEILNSGKEFNTKNLDKIIKYLKNVMPKNSFSDDSSDIYFNGLCAFMNDARYIVRMDIESEINFVLSKPMSTILQSILSTVTTETFYIYKSRSDIYFLVNDILYEVNSVDNHIKDISEIINSFERDDYFKINIQETIKYVKLAQLFSGSDDEANVIFDIKNGEGRIIADSESSTANSKFVAENGIESNFSVNIVEFLKVLQGIHSLGIENMYIEVDSENECLYFEYGDGDCYMSMNNML